MVLGESDEATVTVATTVEGVKEDDIDGWHPCDDPDESASGEEAASASIFRLSSMGEEELDFNRRQSLSLGLRLMVLLFKWQAK